MIISKIRKSNGFWLGLGVVVVVLGAAPSTPSRGQEHGDVVCAPSQAVAPENEFVIIAAEPPYPVEEPWQYDEFILERHGVDTSRESLEQLALREQTPAGSGLKDSLLRDLAVRVLGGREGRSAIPVLKMVLVADPLAWVQRSAAVELARLGDEVGRRHLEEAFEKAEDLEDAVFLAGLLARVEDARGYPALLEAAMGNDLRARLAATDALIHFVGVEIEEGQGTRRPSELLAQLAGDADERVRSRALAAFPKAVENGAPVDVLKEVAEFVAEHDSDEGVRTTAVRVLRLLDYQAD